MIAFFRLLAIGLALAILGLAVAYVFTRERRHLRRAWILIQVGIAGAFVFFGVLIVQRIWFPIG